MINYHIPYRLLVSEGAGVGVLDAFFFETRVEDRFDLD